MSSGNVTSHLDGLIARLSRGTPDGFPRSSEHGLESQGGSGQQGFARKGDAQQQQSQTLDLSRTNELLQQLVDSVRKNPRTFLPTGEQYGAIVKQ